MNGLELKADLMRRQLTQLVMLADVFDRSYSFHEHGVEHRALMGWYPQNVSMKTLSRLCLDWGLPQPLVEQWCIHAVGGEGVGLSFNQELTSVRLYTHKWTGVSLSDVGVPVYKGFKLHKDQSLRIDDYINYCDLRTEENLAIARTHSKHPEWIDKLTLEAASEAPLLFTRTLNTSRQSWLVTARYAELDARQITGESFKGKKLLHLAGGIDAVKGEFSTVYIKATPSEVIEFLENFNDSNAPSFISPAI